MWRIFLLQLNRVWLLTFSTLLFSSSTLLALAQQPIDAANKSETPRVVAFKQLNDQFEKYNAQEKELHAAGARCMERLRAARLDLAKVDIAASVASAIQQQAAASEEELRLALQATRSEPSRVPPWLLTPAEVTSIKAARAQIAVIVQGEQLNQLSSAALTIVNRFRECFQDWNDVQNSLMKNNRERSLMLDRYWEFADPGSVHSIAENEAMLVAFGNVPEGNHPARIAKCLFYRRIYSFEKAIDECSALIESNGPYTPIALAIRASAYAANDEANKSKSDMAKAIKVGKEDPYVRWMRARIASSQHQWSTAEEDWRFVIKSGKNEILARRELGLVLAAKQQIAKRPSKKAMDELELASGLTSERDWTIELACAFALHVADKKDEAIKKCEKALELAKDEQKDVCETILKKLNNNEAIDWDFSR